MGRQTAELLAVRLERDSGPRALATFKSYTRPRDKLFHEYHQDCPCHIPESQTEKNPFYSGLVEVGHTFLLFSVKDLQ